MPKPSTAQAVPAGFTSTVPSLADVRSPGQVNRLVASTGVIPFTDAADGYIITLIEEWCNKHSSEAAKDLRFILTQSKWMTGYRQFGKLALEQLPDR